MTKSNKTIRPLRQRMLEDMAIRKLGAKTRKDYIRAVVNFTQVSETRTGYRHCRRSAWVSASTWSSSVYLQQRPSMHAISGLKFLL